MLQALLAQVVEHRAGPFWGWSVADVAIAIVVVLAIIALVWVFVRESGVPIPGWFMRVLLIVVLAVIIVVAIKLVASL